MRVCLDCSIGSGEKPATKCSGEKKAANEIRVSRWKEHGEIAGKIKPPFPDWSHNFFTILLPGLGKRSGAVWEIHLMKKSLAFACCLATVNLLPAASPPRDLVVHEWGTFTSVQGGDGKLISWQAQEIGDLPKFVYDWIRPGRNRMTPTILTFGKGGLAGLQRMETPVIYVYSD